MEINDLKAPCPQCESIETIKQKDDWHMESLLVDYKCEACGLFFGAQYDLSLTATSYEDEAGTIIPVFPDEQEGKYDEG